MIAQQPPKQRKNNKRKHNWQAEKYLKRIALQKIKQKKRIRRIVKLRRIHLQRQISVKYKGCKWWEKFTKIYFGEDYPQLIRRNVLKFLFHGVVQDQNQDGQGEDLYQLVVYSYKVYSTAYDFSQCFIADPNAIQLPHPQKLSTIKVANIKMEHDIRAEYRISASLKYVTSIRDTDVLYNCFNYQQAFKKHNYSQLQCELSLIPQKIQELHEQNHRLWDKIYSSFLEEQARLIGLEKSKKEIQGLQTNIASRDRMLFFKKGFTDKTEDQLQQALQQLQLQQQKMLYARRAKKCNRPASYNDCRICFYPLVKVKNQIIFCSICNISYHVHCFGLQKVQNPDTYICDSCHFMQINDFEFEDSYLRPCCQICFSKKEFPLKQIQKHFYHVTCLYFYNYALTTSFEIKVKGLAAEEISRRVRENGDMRCAYCLPESKENGLTLRCRNQECQLRFHPICAYLKGCQFHVIRQQELQVSAKCHLHTYLGQLDDEIRQIYLRRFFCNYLGIQKLNEQQFKPLYRDQINEINLLLQKLERDGISWQDCDTQKQKEWRLRLAQKEEFRKRHSQMSIGQLLEISVNGEIIEEVHDQQQIYQEQQQTQFGNPQIIQID